MLRSLEKHIERQFLTKLKQSTVNCECFKFEPPGQAGYPDRLVVLPRGGVLWLEFKRPGEEPRELQHHRINRLRALGHQVAVFDNATEAMKWVRSWATNATDASGGYPASTNDPL